MLLILVLSILGSLELSEDLSRLPVKKKTWVSYLSRSLYNEIQVHNLRSSNMHSIDDHCIAMYCWGGVLWTLHVKFWLCKTAPNLVSLHRKPPPQFPKKIPTEQSSSSSAPFLAGTQRFSLRVRKGKEWAMLTHRDARDRAVRRRPSEMQRLGTSRSSPAEWDAENGELEVVSGRARCRGCGAPRQHKLRRKKRRIKEHSDTSAYTGL
jgi:hypothetical protein